MRNFLGLDIFKNKKPQQNQFSKKLVTAETEGKNEIVVAKPIVSPPQIAETMVRPFCIREINHDVVVDYVTYHVRVYDFIWLCMGHSTHARVDISRPGVWEVKSNGNMMLTHSSRVCDCVNQTVGSFAESGMAVNRKLIEACLFPIQNQILKIEHELKSFS